MAKRKTKKKSSKRRSKRAVKRVTTRTVTTKTTVTRNGKAAGNALVRRVNDAIAEKDFDKFTDAIFALALAMRKKGFTATSRLKTKAAYKWRKTAYQQSAALQRKLDAKKARNFCGSSDSGRCRGAQWAGIRNCGVRNAKFWGN